MRHGITPWYKHRLEPPMKLLIVEDQLKTGQYLRQGLSEAGFNADLVADGITGQQLALSDEYALLILDVMLPGRDGWQILQAVRGAGLTRQCCS